MKYSSKKMINFATLLCVAFATVVLLSVFAGCNSKKTTDPNSFTVEYENGSAVITGYTGNELDIVIPDSIDNRPVASIGSKAFSEYDLSSIVLSENIKSIQYEAFAKCKNLKTVTLNNGLDSIGENAFRYCANLSSINFPDSVTEIKSSAFSECSELKKISIPKSLTSISSSTFSGCSSLESVEFKEGLNKIGRGAFSLCSSLQEITFPDSLTSIESYAFSGCTNLGSVNNLNKEKIQIGEDAFENTKLASSKEFAFNIDSQGTLISYSGTEKNIIIPDEVVRIEDSVFFGNDNIESVTIPKSVREIGQDTFSCCDNLREVNLSDGLTVIDHSAFNKCEKLKSMHIPETVTRIGNGAVGTNSFSKAYPDFVLYGKDNSVAEEYANEYGITFIAE